jgi:Mediator complex subunit 16
MPLTWTQLEQRLERLIDVSLPSTVLAVSIVRQYTILAFTMSDGSVQFRFRESLDQASADGSYEEVQSLPQMGFSFPIADPPLYAALSPSACCSVTMDANGDVRLRKMAYEVGDVSEIKDDDGGLYELSKHRLTFAAHFGAFAAVFTLYWVTAWLNHSTVDDLMAIFPTHMNNGKSSL